MAKQIFVNLPVESLPRSVEFFTALGFTFNPTYTDENATCMILGENLFAMLLVKPFFKTFIPGEICDAFACTESITALALDSREEVDTLVAAARAAGAQIIAEPKDYGFMYQHGFRDLDGHLWELFHGDGDPS
ncbi:VOC family protein [Xanthomonas sp.]|uniref:VOC family protein n=1 Tax=Xanthomonas sp. TaxID=29446 RepID=UPI0031BA4A86